MQGKTAQFDVEAMFLSVDGARGLRLLLTRKGFALPSESAMYQWRHRKRIPPQWLATLAAADPRLLLKHIVVK